jgi:TetR/AcrR family transcriptional regulator, transcriptional repressor for nem operon
MNTRSLTKQKKIDALITHAVEAFREKGYHFAGVQDMASTCGISKAAFFQYFGSKENFTLLVIQRYSEVGRKMFDQHFDEFNGSQIEAIKALFTKMKLFVESSDYRIGCLYSDLAAELGGVNSECSKALANCRDNLNQSLTAAIRKGQEAKVIRGDLNPENTASIILNGWTGTVLQMKVLGKSEPAEYFINDYLKDYLKPTKA